MKPSRSEKKALSSEIAARHRMETKIGKQAILDEFCRTTGYHPKCAVQVLNSWGKKIRVIDGEVVELVVGEPQNPRKRTRERIYDEHVQEALRELWELFDYQCGKRLIVLMRINMEVLKAQPELPDRLIAPTGRHARCRVKAASYPSEVPLLHCVT